MRPEPRKLPYKTASFNPRICKRCDEKWAEAYAHVCVSIHASVKDATSKPDILIALSEVSIHASVKDATLPILMLGTVGGFNPRICKRCDFTPFSCPSRSIVSIHASVKDATQRHNHSMLLIMSFNPRICKRCDSTPCRSFWKHRFQSTHL